MVRKCINWIISFSCLFIFCFIAINVYNENTMVSDGIIYNFIEKYLISDNITPIVKFITELGDTLCIIAITIICFFAIRNRKINYCIVINLVIATILNSTLKLIFMRPRPDLDALAHETTYSFPSGHSMISLAFYGYLIYLIYNHINSKKIKWLLISMLSLMILLIGISRIYLGVHYATDVAGGFCLAGVYLVIYINITKEIVK